MGKGEESSVMDFQTYARAHGVLIDRLQDDGKWHRVSTTTHPRKKNGAYRHCGTHAHVQDHATMLEPALWTPDSDEAARIDHAGIAMRAAQAALQIRQDQEAAAKRAGWILHQCLPEKHPYLESKGFPDEHGNVWIDEKAGDRKLCIPMRADGRLVGLQTISDKPGFEKRFLYGQRTREAVYVMDNKGKNWFCEGYATGLSVRAALQAIKVRYRLIVCFSANNLLNVARNHGTGFVVADCDHPSPVAPLEGGMGIKVATKAGLPFWRPPEPGMDFNDYSRKAGLFRASQELKGLVMRPTG